MTVSSIIHKALLKENPNVLWTKTDNKVLEKTIEKHNINLIDLEDILYGIYDIDLVICNNRIINLDKCLELCIFFHCPLIIIDHTEKPHYISDISNNYLFDPIYQIAVSESICNSWNRIHNKVITYDNIIEIIDIMQNMSKEFLTLKIQTESKK
jgi:hypothetical protein